MPDIVEKFLSIKQSGTENYKEFTKAKRTYIYTINEPVYLSVTRNNGVNYTPDLKIVVNDLNDGSKRFLNASGKGDKFKITAIISEDETYPAYINRVLWPDGRVLRDFGPEGGTYHQRKKIKLVALLDYWASEMCILDVVTRAVDIQDGQYIITGNGSRKQTFEGYTYWELEFTRYTGEVKTTTNWDNTYANKAVETYKKKAKKDKAKSSSSGNSKLKKCKVGKNSEIKYSSKKRVTECVKMMQKVLKKKGYYNSDIDGWFGDKTLAAVKQFQIEYNRSIRATYGTWKSKTSTTKNQLRTDGKVDQDTLNAICTA